jgi:hypothetical protein
MDFDNDPELSSLMEQEQEENVSTPTGRVNPYPQDTNKHYAWTKTSKKNKNNGRRPTCKIESLYPPHGFEPPPPPPPAPAIMAMGGYKKMSYEQCQDANCIPEKVMKKERDPYLQSLKKKCILKKKPSKQNIKSYSNCAINHYNASRLKPLDTKQLQCMKKKCDHLIKFGGRKYGSRNTKMNTLKKNKKNKRKTVRRK